MKNLRAYKTELDPNDRQRSALLAHAGCARWAYNWGLRRKIESYEETGKSPSAIDLHREYKCSVCGMVMDRDLNAAMNLKALAGSSPVTACGEVSAGSDPVDRVKLTSLKQEPNSGRGMSLFGSV